MEEERGSTLSRGGRLLFRNVRGVALLVVVLALQFDVPRRLAEISDHLVSRDYMNIIITKMVSCIVGNTGGFSKY